MASLNKVTLIGRLGKDPIISVMQSGSKVANFTVATSETWKDKATGERKERTEWHNVVIMAPTLADLAERYLQKGNQVYIEGKLQTRKWTDKNGLERYTTEVVVGQYSGDIILLEGKPANNSDTSYSCTDTNISAESEQASFLDDDIPF